MNESYPEEQTASKDYMYVLNTKPQYTFHIPFPPSFFHHQKGNTFISEEYRPCHDDFALPRFTRMSQSECQTPQDLTQGPTTWSHTKTHIASLGPTRRARHR